MTHTPKFEVSYIPDYGIAPALRCTHDPGGVPTVSTYTCPAAGLGSQTEFLTLAAAQFTAAVAGVTFLASVDHTTQRAIIAWTGAATCSFAWLVDTSLRAWVGYTADAVAIGSPYSAAAAPLGIWYPARPLVRARPTDSGSLQVSRHAAGAFRTASARAVTRRWDITARIDNVAGNHAELQQFWSLMVNHMFGFKAVSWFQDYTDGYDAATTRLVQLDPAQKTLAFDKPYGTRRIYDTRLSLVECHAGLI